MKQTHQTPTSCPVCQSNLHITNLACGHCHTEIKGHFNFSKFNYLNQETLYFIEVFVKNRGNIKQIEKEMNISYPTVKKYLDEAITSLGYKVSDEDIDSEHLHKTTESFKADVKQIKIDILDQIKAGEIKVEEALAKIKKLKVKIDE